MRGWRTRGVVERVNACRPDLICLTGEMFLASGMAVREHSHEEHVMGCDEIYLYTGAVVHDNNREPVTIGTGELIAE